MNRGFTGSDLARAMRTKLAYAVLDSTAAKGSTWTAGGCWLLADALQKLDPAHAELWVVLNWEGEPEHVVMKRRGYFWDSLGAVQDTTLLRRMRQEEGVVEPLLVPFTAALQRAARRRGIPAPTVGERRVIQDYLLNALI